MVITIAVNAFIYIHFFNQLKRRKVGRVGHNAHLASSGTVIACRVKHQFVSIHRMFGINGNFWQYGYHTPFCIATVHCQATIARI